LTHPDNVAFFHRYEIHFSSSQQMIASNIIKRNIKKRSEEGYLDEGKFANTAAIERMLNSY